MGFDTSAFERAEIYTFENAGTGTVVGPGLTIFDLSLYKDFHIAENHRVQFRVEFFNAFNNVTLNNPGTAFGSAGFGRITSTRAEADARQIQFGLRLRLLITASTMMRWTPPLGLDGI